MDKRYCAPGAWRASRGSIAAIAVIVFLGVSTRSVFAELVSAPGTGPAVTHDVGEIAGLALAHRSC